MTWEREGLRMYDSRLGLFVWKLRIMVHTTTKVNHFWIIRPVLREKLPNHSNRGQFEKKGGKRTTNQKKIHQNIAKRMNLEYSIVYKAWHPRHNHHRSHNQLDRAPLPPTVLSLMSSFKLFIALVMAASVAKAHLVMERVGGYFNPDDPFEIVTAKPSTNVRQERN